MKNKRLRFWSALFCMAWIFQSPLYACTTMLITKGATEDGSVIVSHSDDNDMMDQRIIYVPAADHAPGSTRPVYVDACAMGEFPEYNSFLYPRYVGTSRGPGYENPALPQTKPIGFIPQVPHTYAYFDGNYGIMNEHQLMFGECTDGIKKQLPPEPGKRIFYSADLARVALERCTTAREAIALIGELIETYGYYGTGETLPVGDTEEGWIIEMAPSPTGKGGLWVAKKVPDGEVFVGANEFRIREIDPEDPDLMYSKNLHDEAREAGWWNPEEGKLDWLRAVSKGEYNHPYYSLRRVWRIQSRMAPSLNLSPWVEDGYTEAYPFSVKPDKKLSVHDVMALHRDHYEGTPFDMTKGIAAGPYGYPNRYYGPYEAKGDVGDPDKKPEGAWERAISVSYCGYVFVNQARGWLPDHMGGVMWMGLDKPSETCFIPFYAGVTALPKSFEVMNPGDFSRESAWWAFNFVANWAALKYSYMIKDIQGMQQALEQEQAKALEAVEAEAIKLYEENPEEARAYLTEFCLTNADQVVQRWWDFSEELIAKYSDGFINAPGHLAQEVGYPEEWRKAAGWFEGPTQYEPREEQHQQ